MLRQRLLSAALLIPVVAALAWLGPWTFAAFLSLIAALGGWELAGLLDRLGWSAPPFLPGAAVALFAASLAGWLGAVLIPLSLLGWVIPLIWLFRPRVPAARSQGPMAWMVHALGATYLGLLLAFLARLEPGPWSAASAPAASPGARWVFYALLVIWSCDTGAYALGYLFGRRKLWPEVSPKKTWEGALGGLLAASAAGALLAGPLAAPLHPAQGLALGGLAVVAGQLGDLVESRLKRKAAVKDSGRIVPGHGGMLDRLDSVLFAAPFFYYGLSGLAR